MYMYLYGKEFWFSKIHIIWNVTFEPNNFGTGLGVSILTYLEKGAFGKKGWESLLYKKPQITVIAGKMKSFIPIVLEYILKLKWRTTIP